VTAVLLRGEGGGKHQRLALLRQLLQDALDRRQEAHVEHAVGFVEHQVAHTGQRHRVLLHQVHQAAGRGDQHINPARRRGDLRALADAAVDRGAAEPEFIAIALHAGQHLGGELTRRHQHQGAHALGHHALAVLLEHLQDRQGEAGGLAGAGLRAGHQIVAGEHFGDGLHLDRRRRVIACGSERAQEFGAEPQRFERHWNLIGRVAISMRCQGCADREKGVLREAWTARLNHRNTRARRTLQESRG
jgi:hypothetical protein